MSMGNNKGSDLKDSKDSNDLKDSKVMANAQPSKQGWEIKKLGDVCNLYQPKTISGEMLVEDGKYLVYGANGVIGRYNEYNHENNEVLLTCRGATCGTINVSEPYSWINGNAMVVQPKNDNIAKVYLQYQLKAVDWSKVITGAAQPQITRQSLNPLEIYIPPREEQEKIVAELDCLSGVIEKKKEQLKELDSLAQSIFYSMFGDPITNEKGWEVKKVIDVVKMQRGFDLPVQDRDNGGTTPIYGSNGIIGYHSTHKAKYGIITGRSGTLGEVYSSNKPFWPLNTTLFSVETHGNNIIFLKFLMANFHLERFKAGAGVPTLNRNEFHNECIPNIPLSLQQEFASKIEAIEKQKEFIKESIKEAETLFNARMQYYFG